MMVRKITDFKDGTYRLRIDNINDDNIVHAMCFTKGRRKYTVIVPLSYLQKFFPSEIRISSNSGILLEMTIINNGNNFYFERYYFSKRMRYRAERRKGLVRLIGREFGSIDRFLQFHEVPIYPNTEQEKMYKLLRQAQHDNKYNNHPTETNTQSHDH